MTRGILTLPILLALFVACEDGPTVQGTAGGPAGGTAGITRVVFTGACSPGAFINPVFGGLVTGVAIADARFTISDPPALLTVWEVPAGFPTVLQIRDSFGEYYLVDGQMLLSCRDGDAIVALVEF